MRKAHSRLLRGRPPRLQGGPLVIQGMATCAGRSTVKAVHSSRRSTRLRSRRSTRHTQGTPGHASAPTSQASRPPQAPEPRRSRAGAAFRDERSTVRRPLRPETGGETGGETGPRQGPRQGPVSSTARALPGPGWSQQGTWRSLSRLAQTHKKHGHEKLLSRSHYRAPGARYRGWRT